MRKLLASPSPSPSRAARLPPTVSKSRPRLMRTAAVVADPVTFLLCRRSNGPQSLSIASALTPLEFKASEVSDDNTLQEIYHLRVIAWNSTLAFPTEILRWEDPADQIATHWGVHCGGGLVAAARMSFHLRREDVPDFECFNHLLDDVEGPFCSMNRLVVHPDFRGFRLSNVLDELRISHARRLGAQAIVITVDNSKRASHLVSLAFVFWAKGAHIWPAF